ncbi:avidin-related protein 1-like [Protobothrops mucrosquamatus]|uniref:avidin-related protein 1-like n=1 Tax=Protobothrops mucrosquamatus TaxID=103944 RepID=UPI0007758DDC|nr:avidin-related protein 1-like [Protobothrops mucrosquamatus]
MAIGLAALGLLAFLLGCLGTFAEPQNSEPAAKCSLTGTWKNDLNSTMEINNVSNTGVFIGLYKAAVSVSGRPIQPSPLLGIQNQSFQFLENTMAIGLAALGLLAFLLGCSGTFAEPQNSERAAKCSLNGSWKNDLNSTMEINNVKSTAVFVGQCLVDNSGKEQLKTTWLLREKVGSAANDWGATRIAKDTFYRT